MSGEAERLREADEHRADWKRWGPYLSERAWGTVREDYSPDGSAWDYFPHDHARSRVYRWGEDGLAGICDRHQFLCFALALWNGRDPILKERPFGLTPAEGNHGEDVKEYYFYLDSTPTHSYMRYLYKYPHGEYPYARLVEENRRRGRGEPEFELLDTGIFDEDRYWDIFVEYAKASPEDLCLRIRAVNRGPEAATLHLLPTLWFRNTWSWVPGSPAPRLAAAGPRVIEARHPVLGPRWLSVDPQAPLAGLWFTGNETNYERLWGTPNPVPHVKDAFHRLLIQGERGAINAEQVGTKAAPCCRLDFKPAETHTVRLRLADRAAGFADFEEVFAAREAEADAFYLPLAPPNASLEARRVQRQAFAGLLWSKQYYYYDVGTWLGGDPGQPAPPLARRRGRNREWEHLYNDDVLSMPDKWEFPWYAAWDLAVQCIPLALVDPQFAKRQLLLLLREWYMHPNGQLPAYEWRFGDVNPPVHAWAAWRVYQIDRKRSGRADRDFLERVFHKLLLNFTWWVNRKDAEGNNLFEGGFLGLDNIGLFDRSAPLPDGGCLEQSDGTAWMAMYTLNMLAIAIELAHADPVYEDIASKFFEHFVTLTHAINTMGEAGTGLWNEAEGFYYDLLRLPDGCSQPVRVRSLVGLIPLCAVETLDSEVVDGLPGFKARMEWFLANRPKLREHIENRPLPGGGTRRLLSVVNLYRIPRLLSSMLDEAEFLSPHGIRSVSRAHREQPFRMVMHGREHRVDYQPGESTTDLFGGNSNWRGPVWFPVNYLLIEALQKYDWFAGDRVRIEFPTGSGRPLTLGAVAAELSRRLTRLFLPGSDGRRPVAGPYEQFQRDPHWRELVLFHEYFHGDTGQGLGASHQTGWTALVAKLIQQSGE